VILILLDNIKIMIRKIFYKIQDELENNLILLLIWARQVGKTTVLKQLRESISSGQKTYFLNLEDPDIKTVLNIHPNKIFEIIWSNSAEKQIVFIDEIQYLDNPTNFLKYLYDEYKDTLKLVVSWSSSFYIDQNFKDSLIGRKKVFNMYTLDFEEFLDFKEENEIKTILFKDKNIPLLYRDKIAQLFWEYISYWWYPEIVLIKDHDKKIQRLNDFTFDYIKKDIYDANISDSDKFFSILKILANQTWELVNMNEIANTCNLSLPTVEKYIYIMQKSFHVALIRPYHTNIRKELSKMPKIYFYDLWFRNSLLRNFEPILLRWDKWASLENIVFRELLFGFWKENIKFWRTQAQNEVDFIINESQAIEVKFNKNNIKESKYKLFQNQYPNITLEYLVYDTCIQKIINIYTMSQNSQ